MGYKMNVTKKGVLIAAFTLAAGAGAIHITNPYFLPALVEVASDPTAYGPTDPEGAYQTLENAGYSNIQIGGYDWRLKGRDDYYSTSFDANGPTGRPVSGAVTRGYYKGNTIRFE